MRRIAPWLLAGAAVAATAAVATADLWAGAASAPVAVVPAAREVEPASIVLACPSGVVDPYSMSAIDGSWSVWDGARSDQESLEGAISLSRTTGAAGGALAPAVTIAAQGTGELRGIAATRCTAPQATSYVTWGSTDVGEELVLELVNPGPSPVGVTVHALGEAEPVLADDPTVRVPARSSVRVLPASWYPDQKRLSLRLEADGRGIAAWAQTSGLDGDAPRGMDAEAATAPGTDLVLPGSPSDGASTLVLVNPGDQPAIAHVAAMAKDGETTVGGLDEVEVPVDGSLAVGLDGLPEGTAALHVTATGPVLATVEGTRDGSVYADDEKWGARTIAAPVAAGRQTAVPGRARIVDALGKNLKAAPLRQSIVAAPGGDIKPEGRLVIANPGTDGASVDVGGTALTIAPGAAITTALPTEDGELASDHPVAVALEVSASLPTGAVRSIAGLERTGAASASSAIDLQP